MLTGMSFWVDFTIVDYNSHKLPFRHFLFIFFTFFVLDRSRFFASRVFLSFSCLSSPSFFTETRHIIFKDNPLGRVSQTKIKVSTFAEFLCLFPLLGRFAFNNSKKWMCLLSFSLIGPFWQKTKKSWVLSFGFVIELWPLANLLNISLQKIPLGGLNRGEHVHSPLNDEKMVHFCGDFFSDLKKNLPSQFAAKRK